MYLSRIKQSSSVLLIAGMFAAASAAALSNHIPIQNIMKNYSFNVLIILISMELFTNLITETGIMQVLSVRLAALSKGRKRLSLVFFGILMFLISSFLNNITAVMMVLPVMFVLLKTIDVDERYVSTFFAGDSRAQQYGRRCISCGRLSGDRNYDQRNHIVFRLSDTCLSSICCDVLRFNRLLGNADPERKG